MLSDIHYVIGDATDPQGDGPKMIAHICNDYGGWGRGFVLALSARDKRPEQIYRTSIYRTLLPLGMVWLSPFDPTGEGRTSTDMTVANMVAQHGNSTPETPVAVSYKALWECLLRVGEKAETLGATVHMPRIGCGLGGGDWVKIERLVRRALVDINDVNVYVYDLPK